MLKKILSQLILLLAPKRVNLPGLWSREITVCGMVVQFTTRWRLQITGEMESMWTGGPDKWGHVLLLEVNFWLIFKLTNKQINKTCCMMNNNTFEKIHQTDTSGAVQLPSFLLFITTLHITMATLVPRHYWHLISSLLWHWFTSVTNQEVVGYILWMSLLFNQCQRRHSQSRKKRIMYNLKLKCWKMYMYTISVHTVYHADTHRKQRSNTWEL